jgi:hypothetical protein
MPPLTGMTLSAASTPNVSSRAVRTGSRQEAGMVMGRSELKSRPPVDIARVLLSIVFTG